MEKIQERKRKVPLKLDAESLVELGKEIWKVILLSMIKAQSCTFFVFCFFFINICTSKLLNVSYVMQPQARYYLEDLVTSVVHTRLILSRRKYYFCTSILRLILSRREYYSCTSIQRLILSRRREYYSCTSIQRLILSRTREYYSCTKYTKIDII